jgi:ABC-type uncharacterized transport system substrate-binding protein
LVAKRLELLRALVPGMVRVAVLINPTDATSAETTLRDAEPSARAMGLQVQVHKASTSREIDAAFATFVRERPDALFVNGNQFFNSRRVQLVHLASHHRIPATYGGRDYPDIGGLMSYGTNITDAYRQLGVYVGRILKGAKPADQVRTGHQRPDSQNARAHRAADAAQHCRRGDRIAEPFCCGARVRFWHLWDIARRSS